ncbi:peptidoglycan-binding domain-containing protein [Leifsonia xyli]|uniref:peptidoglycan-binding domain-containing protein n=1 Tax=Leifsonia xyli TaxID=1575 RepID=UPI003D66DE84
MSAQQQTTRPSIRYAVIVVVAALAIALGSGVTAALTAARPESLTAAKPATRVPVAQHDFEDARAVQVTVSRGLAVPVLSNVDGHVTDYACAPDQPIVSGGSPVAVNGAPLLALSTAVPLWRDLAPADTGPDVRALQVELRRLGYDISADGTYGANTANAVERVLTEIDAPNMTRRQRGDVGLPLSRVVWIPAPSVSPATCDSQLGARVRSGDTLMTTAPAETVARVTNMPRDLVPGTRVFTAGGIQAPVNANGTITDAPSVAALSDLAKATVNDSSSTTNASKDDVPLASKVSGQVALATPRATNSVPPSAIVGVDGAHGCVVSDGRAVPVTIIGSQLGQTFVDFASTTARPRTVQASPAESTSCG